jgi:hypothetical protein
MHETAGSVDLARLLQREALSPAQAAAVGLGLLTALEDLHEAGRSAGVLRPEDVLLGRDGRVRLRTDGQEHPSSSDQISDLRQAGRVICAALGIAGESDTGALRPAERAMPAVCATARAIANGAMGRNVSLARASFADTAGSLVAPERLRLSENELAERSREAVAGTPADSVAAPVPPARTSTPGAPAPPVFAPAAAPPPAPRPEPSPSPSPAAAIPAAAPAPAPVLRPATPPTPAAAPPPAPRVSDWERRQQRVFVEDDRGGPPLAKIAAIAGVLLVLLVAGGLGVFVIRSLMLGNGSPAAGVQTGATASPATHAASPSAAAKPSPSGAAAQVVPQYAPAAAGTTKSVQLALNGGCDVGASCALETTVTFTLTTSVVDYAWIFKVFDPCTGSSTDDGGAHVTAQVGWNHVIGDRTIALPQAKGVLYLVAVTTSPDQAASPPLTVGQGGC